MANSRALSRSELVALRNRWRSKHLTVVFTNGCYDLLHPGHLRFLEQASALGDRLIVGLNSDASVRRLKGAERPVMPEAERAEVVAALRAVDAVTLFDEDTPAELVAALVPDVLVKGADWSHLVVGREVVEASGGQVVLLPLLTGYSTSALIAAVRNGESLRAVANDQEHGP